MAPSEPHLGSTRFFRRSLLALERIASSPHVAEATVKRHLAKVCEKMGVRSTCEASREALLRDWITTEGITTEEVTGEEDGPGPRSASEAAASTAPSRSSVEASRSSVRPPSALRRASMPSE